MWPFWWNFSLFSLAHFHLALNHTHPWASSKSPTLFLPYPVLSHWLSRSQINGFANSWCEFVTCLATHYLLIWSKLVSGEIKWWDDGYSVISKRRKSNTFARFSILDTVVGIIMTPQRCPCVDPWKLRRCYRAKDMLQMWLMILRWED